MKFHPTALPGAYLIELEPIRDERGYFARTWCQRELADQGLEATVVQCSLSHNLRPGTVRGMHLQRAPHEETKLVRCNRGAIYDVLVDLRPASPTHRQWQGFELTADNHRMLYIPPGLAHGFQTLAADCDVFYMMTTWYQPASAAGVRWDDPAFGIQWPLPVSMISERDRLYPDYSA
ncbi:MAG: dTDP-4-dehydrorhamnose 3,5-epimerase [Pirellulales bacterium]